MASQKKNSEAAEMFQEQIFLRQVSFEVPFGRVVGKKSKREITKVRGKIPFQGISGFLTL